MSTLVDLDELPTGTRLRVRRVLLGCSQRELARRLGACQPDVSNVEREHPKAIPALRERLDRALDALEQERAAAGSRNGPESDGGSV